MPPARAAMVPHAGPDSRVFREICELGKELADFGDRFRYHDWDMNVGEWPVGVAMTRPNQPSSDRVRGTER